MTITKEQKQGIEEVANALLSVQQLSDRCHMDHFSYTLSTTLEEYQKRYDFVKNDADAALCWMSEHFESLLATNYAIGTIVSFAEKIAEELELVFNLAEEDEE